MRRRQPFGFNRSLFITGPFQEDELSFEEYRAQFYTVKPSALLQTPSKKDSSVAMECESSAMSVETNCPITTPIATNCPITTPIATNCPITTPIATNPARRKLDFNSVTPLAKGMNELSLFTNTLSDDLTVNTRGVLNEMSDIFGR